MSIVDTLTRRAGQLAEDLQTSLRRARIEGERRLLTRAHRTALEELGARVHELAKAGDLRAADIAIEIAAVDSRAMELAAKVAEIEELRAEDNGTGADGASPPLARELGTGASGAGPGWDAADRFFALRGR